MVTLVTNSPRTNFQPSMREMEVVTVVKECHVISYTNNGVSMLITNEYRFMEMPERFVLKEEWVKTPDLGRIHPPPFPLHR